MEQTDANTILTFTEALLRFIYELPEKAKRACIFSNIFEYEVTAGEKK